MINIELIHKFLLNPEEVNEKESWSVAKFDYVTVAKTEIDMVPAPLYSNSVYNEVYHKSQNISESWTKEHSDFWTWTLRSNLRSTSVGDRIKINDRVFEVVSIGFDELIDIVT